MWGTSNGVDRCDLPLFKTPNSAPNFGRPYSSGSTTGTTVWQIWCYIATGDSGVVTAQTTSGPTGYTGHNLRFTRNGGQTISIAGIGSYSYYVQSTNNQYFDRIACTGFISVGPVGDCWPSGSRVRIVPGSRYGHQNSGCGTLSSQLCKGDGYQAITFDDGYYNAYEFEDYEQCP